MTYFGREKWFSPSKGGIEAREIQSLLPAELSFCSVEVLMCWALIMYFSSLDSFLKQVFWYLQFGISDSFLCITRLYNCLSFPVLRQWWSLHDFKIRSILLTLIVFANSSLVNLWQIRQRLLSKGGIGVVGDNWVTIGSKDGQSEMEIDRKSTPLAMTLILVS